MNKEELINLPETEPTKSTYSLGHRNYYYKTRKYKDAINRWFKRYDIPLSVYERYIDDEMEWVELEDAYLAIYNYVNLLKIERLLDNHKFGK